MSDSENADDLFSDALQALLAFQQLPMVAPLSGYDVALLRRELELFPEWYVKRELGIEFDAAQQVLWQQAANLGIAVQAQFDDFLRASDLMGVQRHLKVIGIFARICHRDGKPRYLADVPRFFSYIEAVLARRPELAQLGELLAGLRAGAAR